MNVIIYCLHDNGTTQAGAKTEAQQHANAKPQEIAHPPLGCFRAWPASEPWSSCLTRRPGTPRLATTPKPSAAVPGPGWGSPAPRFQAGPITPRNPMKQPMGGGTNHPPGTL